MKNIKISIIVPVYNVPKNMLEKCITSLCAQTYNNYEIIIVDDGSSKKTADQCDTYSKKTDKIKVYHKQNGGLCSARNYGVKKSTGNYITFVDGDDYLEKDILKKIITKMDLDCDIVCFGTIKEYKNKKFNYDFGSLFEDKKIYKNNKELLELLLNFNSNIGDVTAKLYKRDFIILNDIEHDEEIKQGVEAIDFNFKCFEKCNKLQFLKEYGYNYAYNEKSITLSQNEKSINLLLKGIEKLYKDACDSKYKEEILKKLYIRINYVTVTTAISGIFISENTKYKEAKIIMDKYLNDKIVKESLKYYKYTDIKRRILLFLIKNKLFLPIVVASKLRKLQKEI